MMTRYVQMQETTRELSNDYRTSNCLTVQPLSFAVYSRMHTCRHCAYLRFVYACARKCIYIAAAGTLLRKFQDVTMS